MRHALTRERRLVDNGRSANQKQDHITSQRLETAILVRRKNATRIDDSCRVLNEAKADLERSQKILDDVACKVKDVLVK